MSEQRSFLSRNPVHILIIGFFPLVYPFGVVAVAAMHVGITSIMSLGNQDAFDKMNDDLVKLSLLWPWYAYKAHRG